MEQISDIRNIAIIAHVDHGKTTLIDQMLAQSDTTEARDEVPGRAMDTHTLEQERGITILSKCTALEWNGLTINIVDTPGHADFGGEVERVLKLVDSVLLLVDAFEGPMPQTKYVLGKSLELGHQPVIALNKIDRKNARPDEVLDEVFELFMDVGADDSQLDFPFVYSSGLQGIAKRDLGDDSEDLTPLFEMIAEHVEPPTNNPEKGVQMQVATLDYDDYVGRLAIGRTFNGSLAIGDRVAVARRDGSVDEAEINKLYGFRGLDRIPADEVGPGQLCAIAGVADILPGETICELEDPDPMPMIEIDSPTLSMELMINDSPFSGREGKYLTSRQIEERLEQELQHNVALEVESIDGEEAFEISGRGELHLSVLLEEMRREGFEMQVSKPKVIRKEGEDGEILEPYERVVVEVEQDLAGGVIQSLKERHGEIGHMQTNEDGSQRIEFIVPSKALIGYRSDFMTLTRGRGIMHKNFYDFLPAVGEAEQRRSGTLIAKDKGTTTRYSLHSLQERGSLFVGPGEEVYGGQIIGEANREHDLVVNPCKAKELTNVRAAGKDDALELEPPVDMTLEKAIEFIDMDEQVEITPGSIRIRKSELNHSFR